MVHQNHGSLSDVIAFTKALSHNYADVKYMTSGVYVDDCVCVI